MKKSNLLGLICASLIASYAVPAAAVTIDYSSNQSTINFNPSDTCVSGSIGCFDFGPGNNIIIDTGTATNLTGAILGTFGVEPITTTSVPLLGTVETASVNGTGTLNIFDGAFQLTGTLSWVNIATFGTAGNINATGTANLSSVTYNGTNPDLVALSSVGAGINVLSFQFIPAQSLTSLFTTNTTISSTTFSGSITPVPVPAAVWLFGSGLLGLVAVARRKAA